MSSRSDSSSSSSESSSDKIEQEMDHDHDESVEESYIFIYEDDGKYYSGLDDIRPKDGKSIVIHPVYYEGYEENMTSEEVRYSSADERYVSVSSDEESGPCGLHA